MLNVITNLFSFRNMVRSSKGGIHLGFIEYLETQIPIPDKAPFLLSILKKSKKQHDALKITDCLALFLEVENKVQEQWMVSRGDRMRFREEARDLFPELFSNKEFSILFKSQHSQVVWLSELFLTYVIESLSELTGATASQNLRSHLISIQQQKEIWEVEGNSITRLELIDFFKQHSVAIYKIILELFGNSKVQRMYEQAYKRVAGVYQYLDSFYAVIALLPDALVTPEMFKILKKGQLTNLLYSKVEELERTNAVLQETKQVLEREKQEKERSYEQLRTVLNTVNECIITTDKKGNVLMVNNMLLNVFGYTREELVGKNITQLMPQKYRERHLVGLKRYRTTRTSKMIGKAIQVEGVKANGKVFPIEIRLNETILDDELCFTAAITDITERMINEQRIKSIARFPNENKDPVMRFDNEGNILYQNKASAIVLPLIQNKDGKLNEKYSTLLNQAFKSNKRLVVEECSGKEYYQVVIVPNHKENDINFYTTNITLQKNAEKQLLHYNNRLESEVKKRTQDLEKSNEELARFAYVASHDMKAPLRMMSSFVQLLEVGLKDRNDLTSYLGRIKNSSKQLYTLINELLDFSRVSRLDASLEKCNLNEVLEQTLNNLTEVANQKNAQICADKLPTINADKTQMVQLFQNLIGNAIKYNENKPEVFIEYVERDICYEFRIKDNGIGIPSEQYDKIFEPFKRLHNNSKYKGTGVGLSICKEIIKKHEGIIYIEPNEKEGTTFVFTISKTI